MPPGEESPEERKVRTLLEKQKDNWKETFVTKCVSYKNGRFDEKNKIGSDTLSWDSRRDRSKLSTNRLLFINKTTGDWGDGEQKSGKSPGITYQKNKEGLVRDEISIEKT